MKDYSTRSCSRRPRWGEGRRVLLGICGRVCRPALQILTLFQTKIKDVIFHTRFQTWPLISITLFRPALCLDRQKLVTITRLRTPTKRFSKRFCEFVIKVLLPYSRSTWVKSIPVFRPKRRKHYTSCSGTDQYGIRAVTGCQSYRKY